MKLLSRLGTFVGVALAFGLSSCGSVSGESCGSTQPCGGDPTGTWKITSTCTTDKTAPFEASECPTATATISSLSMTGTLSFKADKSYSLSRMISGSLAVSVPASCLVINGLTVTCLQLTQLFQAEAATGTVPFSSASCTGSNGCNCAITLAPQTQDDAGTWTSVGTNLALASSVGADDGGAYCVKDNQLHLISLDTTMPMGPMGTAKIRSDIVATKQ